MEYITTSHGRVLALYQDLLDGGGVNAAEAAERFGVSTKTIKRDINDIRNFLFEQRAEQGVEKDVVYDRKENRYFLEGNEKLTSKELFALCKILLESRAFCKSEFDSIINKLMERCANDKEQQHIREMLANERFHYCPPKHGRAVIDIIWDLSLAIKNHNRIKVVYERLTEPKHKERIIEPVGIMFSDFYFYLAAFIPEKQTEYPTIYRVDRICNLKILDEIFRVPYSNRFEEGEFRKRIQFMYGGDLLKLELKYYGESIEAIMDRLPTAEILSHEDGCYTLKAEVFGRGIKPWILSQTDKIEVVKPVELRNEMKEMIEKMLKRY